MPKLSRLVIAASLLLLAAPAVFAQTAQDEAWCRGRGDVTPDQQIKGCTVIIDSEKSPTADFAIVFALRAIGQFGKGEFDKAIIDFEQALKLDPELITARTNRGNAYQAKGEREKAIAEYELALKLDKADPDALTGRGRAQFAVGAYGPAAADFSAAIAGIPDDAYSILWLYLARARSGDAKASGELQANLAKVDPKFWPTPIAELYLGRRTPDALMAAAMGPEEKCEAEFYIGEWHLLRSEAALAGPRFKQAVADCPKIFWEFDGSLGELKRLGQ